MFAPTKVWRKWHRKVTSNQRRYAVCSALAASAVPALVMARGHRIEQTAEIPLVLSTAATQGIAKTKQAVALLTALNVIDDVEHVKSSRKIRAGRGKIRNRRYVQRKGPLVVYKEASPFLLALRNIPGVEVADVSRLNLLQLAPGGHLGRFIVWVQDAFESLDDIFGNERRTSKQKKGYRPPRHIMANADVPRLLNSEEVKSSLRPAGSAKAPFQCQKRNPLKNYGAYLKLNPAAAAQKRKLINNLNAKKAAGKKTQKKRARNVDRSVAKKNLLA